MEKFGYIESIEIKNTDKVTESHFNEDGHKDLMYEIKKEKAEQKESDKKRATELTGKLFEDEKMPVNNFIDNCKKEGLNEKEICLKLLKEGYGKKILDSNLDKNILDQLNNQINNLFNKYGYKIGSKDAFKDLFFGKVGRIINEYSNLDGNFLFKKVEQELQEIKLNSPISMDFIKDYLGNKRLGFKVPKGVTLHGDWSNSIDVLNNLSFYPNTFGKDCRFPNGWNPEHVFKEGKSIGLGIDKVHKKGYTGENVNVAIIDNPLTNFHGTAVKSILVGQETGIAPQANLEYIASSSETNNTDIYENLTKLKDKDMKVISMSSNLYQPWMVKEPEEKEKIDNLVNELNEKGTRVLSGDEFIKNFGILGKKNPMGDINNFDNYQVTWPDQRSIDRRKELLDPAYKPKDEGDEYEYNFTREYYNKKEIDIKKLIFINSGDRTVEDTDGLYRHDAIGGTSWTIPAVAGYYTLVCQADPNMTPGKFMDLARTTAKTVEISDIPQDMNNMTKGRVPMSTEIKVLDIDALIQEIEKQKLNNTTH